MSNNFKFYGSLTKEAGLMDYVGAANRGAGIALNGDAPAFSPIKAMKGMVHGIGGQYAKTHGYGDLQRQGVAFDTDAYGLHPKVNVGNTITGVGNKLFDGIGDKVKGLFEPGGVQNAVNGIGGFLNNHKGSILGGAALLGGGYLLNGMFSPKPRRRYSVPQGYMDQQPGVPQAFQKAAQLRKNASTLGFMSSPMQIPQRGAELVINGLDIPGIGGELQGQKLAPTQPYQPNIKTDNAQLKKTLQDPRMRQYLTTLIQQVETNRSSQTT